METNWKKGDIIKFVDELYEVIENYGSTGKVKPVYEDTIVNKFYWEYGEEKCQLVSALDLIKQIKELNKEIEQLNEKISGLEDEIWGDDL